MLLTVVKPLQPWALGKQPWTRQGLVMSFCFSRRDSAEDRRREQARLSHTELRAES